MLRVRERTMRALDNVKGNTEWMLQALVRAWKFPEQDQAATSTGAQEQKPTATVLPPTFRFTISDVLGRRAAHGQLDWFDVRATLLPEGLGRASGLRMAELRAGDVLEVKLSDVNVHRRQVRVEALRKVE